MTALNPLYTVGEQVSEVLRAHHDLDRREAMTRTVEMLRSVGIPAPKQRASMYPHQLSGGMRQRVMIAMALVCEPAVLICDEPTTALDVTVQGQVLDLLRDLRDQTGTAIIMITHDMGVVAEIADRVLVMYAGRKIEQGSVRDIIRTPTHPYTEGLISCVPAFRGNLESEPEPLPEIPGTIPPLTELGIGCVFEQRCPLAIPSCKEAMPPMIEVAQNHGVACWVKAGGLNQ
jgi:peptide/nickel transport system ATP-binding protein